MAGVLQADVTQHARYLFMLLNQRSFAMLTNMELPALRIIEGCIIVMAGGMVI